MNDGLIHGNYNFFAMESHYCACFVDDANHENCGVGVEEVFRTTILGPNCLESQIHLMYQVGVFMVGTG